jgi:hypothetical protein
MRDQATADAIESMELYSNLHRRESTLGYLRPIAFEESEAFAEVCVHGIGRRSFCSLAYGVSDVLRRDPARRPIASECLLSDRFAPAGRMVRCGSSPTETP